MSTRRLATKIGVVSGVGAVLTSFGVVTPALAYTCDATISPTETALRDAIANGDTTICINAGTLNMGDGGSIEANIPIVINSDLTLVGLGDVVVDGNNNTAGFIVAANDTDIDIDLVIDNLLITNFHDGDYDSLSSSESEKVVPIVGFNRNVNGTITVLNSAFENNSSYVGIVAAVDQDNWEPFGTISIDNTVFENNYSSWGTVWGYSDISVTDSSFLGNTSESTSSGINQWSTENTFADSTGFASGNYFADNSSSESTVYFDSPTATIVNNTFDTNYTDSNWAGSAIATTDDSSVLIGFNTFIDNDSDYDMSNISVGTNTTADMVGNVFSVTDQENAVYSDGTVNDHGGNVSTADDSTNFTASTSHSPVTQQELALVEPDDNGGSTFTSALGSDSIARNLVNSASVSEFDADLSVDQRGETRGALMDAGAWDDGEGELAATGVDATGIALTGGIIGAAGVALVTRRRRNA